MGAEGPGEMRIGEVLSQARARAGIELTEVEEQTKIRAKYLRALEAEDWAELPNPAYAKGFLRTYGQLLGLDAEALVDEYRRQVESELTEPSYPLGDQVLERRRRPGGGPSGGPRAITVLALLVLVAAGVVAFILFTGDDDEGGRSGKQGDRGRRASEQRRDERQRRRQDAGPVELALRIREPVEVCLLGGGGEALIDGQVLPAGAREVFERMRFELRFPSGFAGDQLTVKVAGSKRSLPKAEGPAAYEIIAPQRVKAVGAPGQSCP